MRVFLFANAAAAEPWSDYVNVFVGTQSTGNTFPGATVPHGLVQLSPILLPHRGDVWAYNSGYHRLDGETASQPFVGLGHTALSGTGLNDGGDFILLPRCGAADAARGRAELLHATEAARPGVYGCRAAMHAAAGRCEVAIEAAATSHGGVLRFGGARRVDVELDSPLDAFIDGSVWIGGPQPRSTAVFASRRSKKTHHCSANHEAFWAATFDPPFTSLTRVSRSLYTLTWEESAFGNGTGITAYVGLSHVDVDGARRNKAASAAPGGGAVAFDVAAAAAAAEWDAALGRVAVTAAPAVDMRRFYTALYHSMLGPTLFSDVDGRYKVGGNVLRRSGATYSTFSLWDTYRAQMPLLNLVSPELSLDFVESLLDVSETNGGVLPRWVLFGVETKCMSGYPAAVTVADALLRNATTRDASRAAALARRAAPALERTGRSLPYISEGRPIPYGETFAVSLALEAAVADSCISRFAERQGDSDTAKRYARRGKAYEAYYDTETSLLLAKDAKGRFARAAPGKFERVAPQFEEGTPLQYSFMAPHDARGLARLFGGPKALEARLDSYFSAQSVDFNGQRDLETGYLGGHCHGNEPGHHAPYLYNAARAPAKAQKTVRQIAAFYTDEPDGLPGNDDVGQTSAWLVFSMLGFYPVDPCGTDYEVGTPFFDADVAVGPGATLKIRRHGQGDYVEYLRWNRRLHRRATIDRDVLSAGGALDFYMTSDPEADLQRVDPAIPNILRIGEVTGAGETLLRRRGAAPPPQLSGARPQRSGARPSAAAGDAPASRLPRAALLAGIALNRREAE
ncbi:glycosyl hydrolase family 92-domain-containing protein [Pelagophyceae sp. CCMP2097]|nr:glycosyl hydrolase family 92-domain-containing protein [Pelagophyceae sp. CCMP2097]